MADGEVDRNKATVENNPSCSTVDRAKATVEPSTVDRNKATVEASDGDTVNRISATMCPSSKYTLIFYIQENPPPNKLLKHLPTGSQHHPWNQPIIFGRGENVDIFLNDDGVSRVHLELTGQCLPPPNMQVFFSIRNVSKTIGVFVDGHEIPRNQMHFMKSGEIITIGCAISFKLEINPGEDMENYVLKFVHPDQNDVCGKQPVQEVESQRKNVGRNQVTKQPSENKEDENDGKPTQDTQQPKHVD